MRLKTGLWVAAYLRRCQVEGIFGVVRRRGAEESGAVFVRVNRLDGTSDLFGPAPQSAFEAAGGRRAGLLPCLATAVGAGCGSRGLPGAATEIRSRYLDRRDRGSRRAQFPRRRCRLRAQR